MICLGIETSGLDGSVALWRDGAAIERKLATAGRRHAQTLIAELRDLLADAAVPLADVDGVAVSIGPGSFTGLRVGVVAAKTLAYSRGLKVVAVDTLAAIADRAPPDWPRVFVVSDAQRGDLFLGEYRRDDLRAWQSTGRVRIVPGDEWLASRAAGDTILGPGVSRLRTPPDGVTVVHQEWSTRPSAAAIAAIGATRLLTHQSDDLWTLSPVYIRPSAAEEKRTMTSGA